MKRTCLLLILTSLLPAWADQCIRITDTCIEGPETRQVDGMEFFSECWRYRTEYQCLTEAVKEEPYCGELRDKGCYQTGSTCLEIYNGQCTESEYTYTCPTSDSETEVMDCSGQIYCLQGNCFDTGYLPNQDLALSASHLVALDAMAQDQQGTAPENLVIFQGEDYGCSKSVLGFKNCCKDSGWGLDTSLARCSDNEKILGEKREADLCHKIGSYCSNRNLFGCTSRRTVFCCFHSKLGRMIQEQGRAQLGLGWGSPKRPNCQGFTPEQLQQLDFSQMDFSEFYQDALQQLTPIDEDALQQRLQDRVQEQYE